MRELKRDLFTKAQNFYNKGRWQECIDTLTFMIDSGNRTALEEANAYLYRGNTYKWLREYGEAEEDYQNAIRKYDEIIEKNKENAEAYLQKGNTFVQLGNSYEAINDYTKAVRLYTENNDRAKGYFNRGNVYLHLMRFHKAISDFQ